MRRSGQIRNNLTKGALDPRMAQRLDLKPYYQAAREIKNAIVIPQGGAEDRAGLRHKFRVHRKLVKVPLTPAMLSSPVGTLGGSSLANVLDSDQGTLWFSAAYTPGAGSVTTVFQVALPALTDIAMVDLVGFNVGAGTVADDAVTVHVRDAGLVFRQLGGAVNARSVARTRRFANVSGAAQTGDVIQIRVRSDVAVSTGFALKELRVFSESAKVSQVKRVPFTFGAEQSYTLVLSDRNADVAFKGARVCSVPLPHRSDQILDVTVAAKNDTLMLFHPDVAPVTLFRQGAHDEWDSYAQTFINVQTLVPGASFGSAQDEVQRVVITGLAPGASITFALEDVESAPVIYAANPASMQAAIAAALAVLPNVSPGLTITVTSAAADAMDFTLRFSGAGNTARVWPPIFADVLDLPLASATTTTLQDGRPATGAVMSATTGWPRCGVFFQGRLILGGMKLRPETLMGSVVDDFFNFAQPPTILPSSGFDYSLDSDELAIVRSLFGGRHLQIFTDTSEWYLDARSIDATQPLNFVQTTRYGVKGGIAPVQVDGGTQFVQASGSVLRDFIYSDTEQDYKADNLTLLASHLCSDLRDVAYRRASETGEGNQIYMVNSDGTGVVLVLMRSQEILAASQLITDGLFRGISVDALRQVYALVERTANGVTDIYFEEFDAGAYLDASEVRTMDPAQSVVTGLERLAGKSVYAIADGDIVGPLTVSVLGVLTLPVAASVAEIGLLYTCRVEGLPVRTVRQDGSVDLSPRRIYGAELYLRESTSVQFSANGSPAEAVPLLTFPLVLDQAPLNSPVTGNFRIDGIKGKMPGPDWSAERIIPGRMNLEAVYLEVA